VLRKSGGDAETASAGYRIIDGVVARYRAAGLVDDAAFAAGRARRGLARGRPPARIAAELAAKGVHADDCDAALAALREEIVDPELAAAAAFARRRRLGPFGLASSDRGRELAAFARAGFSRRAAETVLSCPDEAAVAALLGAGG
jgi:regulatory protein